MLRDGARLDLAVLVERYVDHSSDALDRGLLASASVVGGLAVTDEDERRSHFAPRFARSLAVRSITSAPTRSASRTSSSGARFWTGRSHRASRSATPRSCARYRPGAPKARTSSASVARS